MTTSSLVAYALCGLLIAVYAWGRFNTPASNRSSTRQALYWWSCLGYISSALVLFAALGILLQLGPWRHFLLGPVDDPALPAPLIATLAMTTLLPSAPALKRLDASLLAAFLEWGAIPAEVTRRAAAMTPEGFSVAETDLDALRETYGDGSYGETLAGHLRADRGEGPELSGYRFTRVVKLYHGIRRLGEEPRYARFFAENAEEFLALERSVDTFLRRSSASLTVATRLRAVETPAEYEELMHERREVFAQSCREVFHDLALFLAHAVLRSEPTERDIVDRLHKTGFAAAEPMNQPEFPIDSLTLLSVGVFVYLIVVGTVLRDLQVAPHMPPDPGAFQPPSPVSMALKIAIARLGAVAVTVLLIQRHAFFRRPPGASHRYFAYLVCGLVGGIVATGFCLFFSLQALLDGAATLSSKLVNDLLLIILSAIVCAALAFCCNDWPEDRPAPAWLRAAEAAGCAAVVAFGMGIIWFGELLPIHFDNPPAWLPFAMIGLPSLMTAIIGGFVPHIYRRATRAAQAGRATAKPVTPPANAGEQLPRVAGDAPIEPGRSPARLPEARPMVVSAEPKAA